MTITQFLQDNFNYFSDSKLSHFHAILFSLLLISACIALLSLHLTERLKSAEKTLYNINAIHLSLIAVLTGTHTFFFHAYDKYVQVSNLEDITNSGFILTTILSISVLLTLIVIIVKAIKQKDFKSKQYLIVSTILINAATLHNLVLLGHLASQ